MKKIFSIVMAMVAIAAVSTSCSYDKIIASSDGKVKLSMTIDDNVEIVSRAVSETEKAALEESCKIYVYSSKGLIRKYHGADEVPSDLWLASGEYSAEAWAGDSVPASFDKKYYRGKTTFNVSPTAVANAVINCKIANVVASVKFDASVATVLSDNKITIANTKGSLDFSDANADAKGYYMMPSGDTKLTYSITGTRLGGETYTQNGEIEDVKGTTEYALTIKFQSKEFEAIGGGMFVVDVDEKEIEVNDSFEITAIPLITANFDLSQPKTGDAGSFKKFSIYVSAVEELTGLELSGLNSIGFTASDKVEFFQSQDYVKSQLSTFGIEIQCPFATDEHPEGDVRAAKITFTAAMLNTLANGKYSIGIKATDNLNKVRNTTLVIDVSNDAVKVTEVPAYDVWATSATVHGTIAKEGSTGTGVEYRKAGGDWTKVYSDDSAAFSVKLTGLEAGTAYEYRAFADNDGEGNAFTSSTIYTFTTETAAQLPNSGFEDWCEISGVVSPCASESTMFWDCGNAGAKIASAVLTTAESTIKNSGNYSAKLNSKNVVIKFAAGNMFIGKYLDTDGTDGVLGFGRQVFSSRPKSLTGYVKYNPVAINKVPSGTPSECVKGEMDKGIIYIALLDETTESYGGSSYPLIVKTKPSQRRIFDKNESRVIAYGEWTSREATSSDNTMMKFEIPLEYKRTDKKPSAILICCSASFWGDYYAGGDGSVMYIDDFTLNY